MNKYFYAARSDKGLSMTYDSPCWMVHAFTSKQERDQYVAENSDGTETVTASTAHKIAPELKTKSPSEAWRVVAH